VFFLSDKLSGNSKIIKDIDSNIAFNMSKAVIPYSEIFNIKNKNDIYSGNENIPFRNKNPIFRSLMRIEFEDAMREYIISLKSKI